MKNFDLHHIDRQFNKEVKSAFLDLDKEPADDINDEHKGPKKHDRPH